jgi:hypothetical protein
MMAIDVTLKLPDDLVEQARAAGILTDERVAELLAAELERKRRVKTLFDDIEHLHNLKPPMTQEDINAEIQAYRNEKAGARKARQ